MKADKKMSAHLAAGEAALAAEGYHFYARQASKFAEISAEAVAEALESAYTETGGESEND